MRKSILIAILVVFGSVLSAQLTQGLSVRTVIHEPTATEVGPFLASQQVANPYYDPLQPTGEPEFLPLYGNGKGLKHLDSVSGEFYALASTTTHDLCILTNNTGSDIIVDLDYTTPSAGALQLSGRRAAVNPEDAPQQDTPDPATVHNIYGYDSAAVSVPNGSSVAIFLLITKWGPRLITSPRDYFLEFTFTDVATNTIMSFEAKLTVPKAGGGEEDSGCVATNGRFPQGLLLVMGGTMFAMVTRRELLRKARA